MSYDVVALLDDLFDRSGDEDGFESLAVQVSHTIGPEALPMDWRIEWEERAAIMEYDGGLTREEAEERSGLHLLNGQLGSIEEAQSGRRVP